MDKAFVEQMQKKIEEQVSNREIETVVYWKEELEKLLRKKPESVTSLLQEMKLLHDRMENRLAMLKRSRAL